MQSHYYKLIVTKYLKSKNDNMKCKWQNDNQHGNKNDSIMKYQNHRTTQKNNVISQLHSYSKKMPQTKNDSMMNFKRVNWRTTKQQH